MLNVESRPSENGRDGSFGNVKSRGRCHFKDPDRLHLLRVYFTRESRLIRLIVFSAAGIQFRKLSATKNTAGFRPDVILIM
ncbi:hypothetical protein GYMLUDRAFT_701834 [Collybiopsis luxurians FD-317 M1]|uniref:Unplaced genomic scaffold GYMLUscaffold_38, whole genome shotgun sequence n=1 Tax=Collybiopsis luxurians FD-317 M1 TaxID=944289 RepID=A0A0D0CIY2_9AGAR|nr:hypothetical protein GYMLUDRAFT_701834 [Collybiopsis luxurians FD-317 M1]